MMVMAEFEPSAYHMQSKYRTTEPPKPSENKIRKYYLFLSMSMPEARWIAWPLFLRRL